MTVEARVNSWSLLALAVLRKDSLENVQLERHARLSGIAYGLGRNHVWPKDFRNAERDNNTTDTALYPPRRKGGVRS
jgi:hypothetical protein